MNAKEELAETFRRNLGLRTWEEQRQVTYERWNADMALSYETRARFRNLERQTGKTTHGLLLAFAEAIQGKKGTVLIIAPSREMGVVICHRANTMIERLGLYDRLKARVTDHATKCVVYIDHTCDEM